MNQLGLINSCLVEVLLNLRVEEQFMLLLLVFPAKRRRREAAGSVATHETAVAADAGAVGGVAMDPTAAIHA